MAQRVQLKRSSINGKRPEGRYLEPGELALNTNGSNSGLFFEANDGTIVKVGPAVVTTDGEPPVLSNTLAEYSPGEMWLDMDPSAQPTLKVWDGSIWRGFTTFGSVGDDFTFDKSLIPTDDCGSQSLGSVTNRWAEVHACNVYTGDLHMKNDRGDWTAIEEEDFMSLRNNKTGKRYKIMMEEIDEG